MEVITDHPFDDCVPGVQVCPTVCTRRGGAILEWGLTSRYMHIPTKTTHNNGGEVQTLPTRSQRSPSESDQVCRWRDVSQFEYMRDWRAAHYELTAYMLLYAPLSVLRLAVCTLQPNHGSLTVTTVERDAYLSGAEPLVRHMARSYGIV